MKYEFLGNNKVILNERAVVSGREKSIFSWDFGLFGVSLHIRSVYKYLIFSTIKVLIFVEMTKLNASFL